MSSSVVFALDSFKGSIASGAACSALAEGWRSVRRNSRLDLRPMADGGEGTLAAFAASAPASRKVPVTVVGPLGVEHEADWLYIPANDIAGATAVVELASTSGIELVRGPLAPWDASTGGFGQAIAAALDFGVHRLILGVGSSASTDAGAGLLTALGARLTTVDGSSIAPGLRGLSEINAADLSALRPLPPGGAVVLTDVRSPLTGPNGAAYVFGSQKGLTHEELPRADGLLANFAELVCAHAARLSPDMPGAGAAGGAGFALHAWGACSQPGAATIAELVGLESAIEQAAIVITGEGSFDGQSARGKVVSHVAKLARAAGKPIFMVAGRVLADADIRGFAEVLSLTDLAGSEGRAMAEVETLLFDAGAALAHSTTA